MKKLLSLCFILILQACSTTRKVSIDFVRQDTVALENYLQEAKVDFDEKDLAVLNNVNAFAVFNDKERISVPEAYFFNKEGKRVKDNFKGTSCGQVISNPEKISKAPASGEEHLNDWLKYISLYKAGSDNLINDGYDAYVIIPWAIFMTSVSKDINQTSFNWYRSLKNHKNIKVILLNLDVQQGWELSNEQKSALGIK